MKKSNSNSENGNELKASSFLDKKKETDGLSKHHKEYLGLDIPKDYFSKSKKDILEAIPQEVKIKRPFFALLQPRFAYPIAASIVFLIGIMIWQQTTTSEIEPQVTDIEKTEIYDIDLYTDDFLISSLLVEEDEMNQFADNYIMNEIIIKIDLSERELENIFINSLFVKDSFIDSYIEKNLMENIIL